MNSCPGCSKVPVSPPDSGTLFLAPPQAHTLSRLHKTLQRLEVPYERPESSILSVLLTPGRLELVIEGLARDLNIAEQRDTRSLVVGGGGSPSLVESLGSLPLSGLIAKLQGRWLGKMIDEDRLTSHFQPIVRAEALGEVYAYECLLRGRNTDGTLMAPTPMYDAARGADLLFHLDRAARLTAIREAARHQIGQRLFINFNPTSIYDPEYCLKSTISAIDRAGFGADRIVFEVVESDYAEADLLAIMASYRRAGFRVAIDDLGAGYGSLNLLGQLRPDFVKLDMNLVRDVHLDAYKAGITSQILEMARKIGVQTVAEGIETADELAWLIEHGVDYLQGFYIARPDSPPPRLSPVEAVGVETNPGLPAPIARGHLPATRLAVPSPSRLSCDRVD